MTVGGDREDWDNSRRARCRIDRRSGVSSTRQWEARPLAGQRTRTICPSRSLTDPITTFLNSLALLRYPSKPTICASRRSSRLAPGM